MNAKQNNTDMISTGGPFIVFEFDLHGDCVGASNITGQYETLEEVELSIVGDSEYIEIYDVKRQCVVVEGYWRL